jgi:hypothetical protein
VDQGAAASFGALRSAAVRNREGVRNGTEPVICFVRLTFPEVVSLSRVKY